MPLVLGGSFPRIKRPGRETDHLPPSSAEVKNTWSYTSTLPIRLHEFAGDRMSCITLRGQWCDTARNAHALTGDKEGLERVLDHMTILLGDLSAKVGKRDTFKAT
jgi:hypothetical protein